VSLTEADRDVLVRFSAGRSVGLAVGRDNVVLLVLRGRAAARRVVGAALRGRRAPAFPRDFSRNSVVSGPIFWRLSGAGLAVSALLLACRSSRIMLSSLPVWGGAHVHPCVCVFASRVRLVAVVPVIRFVHLVLTRVFCFARRESVLCSSGRFLSFVSTCVCL